MEGMARADSVHWGVAVSEEWVINASGKAEHQKINIRIKVSMIG